LRLPGTTSSPDSAAPRPRQSAPCTGSRKSKGPASYQSPPWVGPSRLGPQRRYRSDDSTNRDSSREAAMLPTALECEREPNLSWPPDEPGTSRLSAAPARGNADARILHSPVGIASATPSQPCLGPFVVNPRIVVTPEYATVDDGATTVWVAV